MPNLYELILIKDIHIFVSFTNFYHSFISSFDKITVLFIAILKISELMNINKIKFYKRIWNKPPKNRNLGAMQKYYFFTSSANKVFNSLWKSFIKVVIV